MNAHPSRRVSARLVFTARQPSEMILQVRIATGRDAADTAFMSSYGGAVDLNETEVTATTDGTLPVEDVNALASIS